MGDIKVNEKVPDLTTSHQSMDVSEKPGLLLILNSVKPRKELDVLS